MVTTCLRKSLVDSPRSPAISSMPWMVAIEGSLGVESTLYMELVPSSRLSRKSVKVPPTSIPILYTGPAPLEDARFFEHAVHVAEDIGHLPHGRVGLAGLHQCGHCLLYTSPSPRDRTRSRMPSS